MLPKVEGFTIMGKWKEGSRTTEEIELSWFPPNKVSGDPGIVAVFSSAASAGLVCHLEGIPFACNPLNPLSVRAFAYRVLHVENEYGAVPQLTGDKDRYLFPTVEVLGGKQRPWKRVSYPSSEAITGTKANSS